MIYPSAKYVFIILLCILAFFSLYRLTESPSVWYDEGIYSQLAANLAQFGKTGLQLSPAGITHISQFTVGYPLIYPLAAAYKVFGASVATGRAVMVAFLWGLSIAAYFLVKRSHGQNTALLALALLATFPVLYGNGKSVLGEVPGLFFLILSLLSIRAAMSGDKKAGDGKRISFFIGAGLCAGLCLATKPIFLVLFPALFAALAVKWRAEKISLKEILVFAIALAVPFSLWIFIQFGSDVTLAGMLSFYANPNQVQDLGALIGRNVRTFLTGAGPLYLLLAMAAWTASIILRKTANARGKGYANARTKIPAEEMAAFFFSILIIGAYLRISGMFRYLFPAQIVALVYLPQSLFVVSEAMEASLKAAWWRKAASTAPIAAVAVLCLIGLYGLLFNSWVADFYGSRKTAFWQEYFENAPAGSSFYFYNTPEVAMFSLSRDYYQYLEPAPGMKFGGETLAEIENGKVGRIIITTDYFNARKEQFEKHYVPIEEAYKYTILGLKSNP